MAKKCYFSSSCEKAKTTYLCCSECEVKNCWQRCYDNPAECGYLNDGPEFVEVVYYNVVNKLLKIGIKKNGTEIEKVKQGEDIFTEFEEGEAKEVCDSLNGDGRKMWSLVETRKEAVER